MNRETKTWVGVILLILVAVSVGGYFYMRQVWWPVKQAKIAQGLAASDFPWRDYSVAELNEMYPQIKNAAVPTRVTPEETYAKFREALRTNNLELAVEQLSVDSSKYEENKSVIEKAFRENRFDEAYKEYPEKIEKESLYEATASYYYFRSKSGGNFKTHISFIKDANGDWKMDSL